MFPLEEASRLSSGQATSTDDPSTDTTVLPDEAIYPGTPWVRWWEGCGRPGYQAVHQNRTIQCPFVRYGVYEGILYELGSKGVGHPQFARELYAAPQQLEEPAADEERSLDVFVWDVPFNFALEQALESLEDPGVLTKVARL